MEPSVSGVGVLDKAMVVLDAVATEPLSLARLCEMTGLPRATSHRLAVALETHGMIRRLDDGRFAPGLRLVGLGRAAVAAFPLAEAARPVLEALRDETGESVQLYVREGHARRCVLSLQSPHALRWIVPEGVILPLGVGSAGKVLTGHAGRSGWVESVEEREPGVCSVSAPVRGAGIDAPIVAAVSVSGPVERLSRNPGRKVGSSVVLSAHLLEEKLARTAAF